MVMQFVVLGEEFKTKICSNSVDHGFSGAAGNFFWKSLGYWQDIFSCDL